MLDSLRILLLASSLVVGAAVALPDEPPAQAVNPTGGGSSVVLEPAPAAAEPSASRNRSRRLVFVCRDESGPVFSDRPCGIEAGRRELAVAEATGAPPTLIPPPARHVPSRAAEPAPEVATRPPGPCRRLRDQLRELDDRMRSGYSAREAARLWNRWRELKARIHEHRC